MRGFSTLPTSALALAALLGLSGCSSQPEVIAVQRPSYYGGTYYGPANSYATPSARPSYGGPSLSVGGYRDSSQITYRTIPKTPTVVSQTASRPATPVSTRPVVRHNTVAMATRVYEQARVRRDILPRSARGRTGRSMRPRYITIHSTQNWSRGADAWRHSLALKRSKLGRLSWHYTVDENVAVQHLPTTEQGKHADMDGPGNHYSIGIEMCEHPGNSRGATLERTARLTAWLMYKHDIPLSRVVPHYHWPRWGKSPPNKNCPHFLLTNGRPGSKWRGYLAKVKSYHDQIVKPTTHTWASR